VKEESPGVSWKSVSAGMLSILCGAILATIVLFMLALTHRY
jgi:hypothetical protein